jgi:hypothetical protein
MFLLPGSQLPSLGKIFPSFPVPALLRSLAVYAGAGGTVYTLEMTMLTGDDLAYATLDYIREHPEQWDQTTWICGTTGCFAGHALALAFRELEIQLDEWTSCEECGRVHSDFFVTAKRHLGWSCTQARHVFMDMTRDFTRLEIQVKQVLNGEIT